MRILAPFEEFVDGQARGFRAKGGPILVYRKGADVVAYKDSCPHLGVDLAWNPNDYMDSDGLHIQCSTHGALFEPNSGLCVSGPCIGQSLVSVSVEVRDGNVVLLDA